MSKLLTLEHQPAQHAPVEYRDAVALYARGIGCESGDVVWVDHPVNCWQVRLKLPAWDPREYETLELQKWVHPDPDHRAYDHALVDRLPRHPRRNHRVPAYVAFDLDELGVEGVLEWLRRTSLAGSGEFRSMEHAMRVNREDHRARQETRRKDAKQLAQDKARATRRRIAKIPFLRVGIELGRKKKKTSPKGS